MTKIAQQKSNGTLISMILLIIAVVCVVAIYFGVVKPRQTTAVQQVKINGVVLPAAKEISDFQLTDNHGKSFTKENLNGHWTMMFFGFTNCGMVCPTTMAALNKMYLSLQKDLPENQLPQIVMVSVDPDRDSVARMDEYVNSFNPHFIGARTEIAPTIALEKQLNIAAAKMESDGAGKDHYTINHSAEILLFNPSAKLQAYMSYPHQPEQMVEDYKLIIKSS